VAESNRSGPYVAQQRKLQQLGACVTCCLLSTRLTLQELGTFGFRGEALSSLCAVADVSVVTRTTEQEVGVRLRCRVVWCSDKHHPAVVCVMPLRCRGCSRPCHAPASPACLTCPPAATTPMDC
jgi:hypothetical protein